MGGGFSRRKTATRPVHEVILIMCEGSTTEIQYFRKYKNTLKAYGIEVIPLSEEHTDPKGIVKDAIKQMREIRPDHTWCVFDKDANTSQQLYEAKKLADKHKIKLAFSNPCFELWYLLHFKFTSAPFENFDKVAEELKKIKNFTRYQKNACYFDALYSRLQIAINNADRLLQVHRALGNQPYSLESNPSTNVHELIGFLEHKKKTNR